MATGDCEPVTVAEPQLKPDVISKTDVDAYDDRVPLDESACIDYPESDLNNTDPNSTTTQLSQTNGVTVVRNISDRERKIGHRRVGQGGEITYKKIQSSQIMGSIQLGIQQAVGGLASKPERDLLMQDFMTVETTNFPTQGSNQTPAHHYSDFRFKTYAPIAFRYFRDLFGIQPEDFLISMCSYSLRELSNPGASGSIFYLTDDDEFIVKTVQHKEGEFLQKLLPGYYMNLNQNPRTLLPKFFGLYCYQCNHKNVRLVVMNNILPSGVRLHQKYDLKGSTYKRKANKSEKQKKSPTFKDLDFLEHHPEGLYLESETYNALVKTIQRDCRVLQSFKIMDYSLLLGIHNMDCREKSNKNDATNQEVEEHCDDGGGGDDEDIKTELNRTRSINRQRLVAHSTAMESIQAEAEPIDEEEDIPPGGIPARNGKGERLIVYVGIIDILQSYRLKKKLEHTFKSMIHDGDTVSVHRPGFYAQRFQTFMEKKVFKKIPSLDLPEIAKGNHRKFRTLVSSYLALKRSPSKRKSLVNRSIRMIGMMGQELETDPNGNLIVNCSNKLNEDQQRPQTVLPALMAPTTTKAYPAVLLGRPGSNQNLSSSMKKIPPPVPPRGSNSRRMLTKKGYYPSCSSTPPPTFAEALDQKKSVMVEANVAGGLVATSSIAKHQYRLNYMESSNKSMTSSSGASSSRGINWTPPRSIEGSTPTWTEGTPSFTESSSSGESRCPTTTPQRQIRNIEIVNDVVVEKAINCLTDGIKELKARVENDFVENRSKLSNVVVE